MALKKLREILKEYQFDFEVGEGYVKVNLTDEDCDELAYRLIMAGHIAVGRKLEKR